MQRGQQPVRRVERLAIDAHGRMRQAMPAGRRALAHLVVDVEHLPGEVGDTALRHQRFHLATRAVAQRLQVLPQLHRLAAHGLGSHAR